MSLTEPLTTICTQISHRGDRAVRMLVPVELSPESSTDYADSDLPATLHFCGQRGGIDQPLP